MAKRKKKMAPARRVTKKKRPTARQRRVKAAPKRRNLTPPKKTAAPKSKGAAVQRAAQRAQQTARLSKDAAKAWGKNSRAAQQVKTEAQAARRWELEARHAKSLKAKRHAATMADRHLRSAILSFQSATREDTMPRASGWKEVQGFRPVADADTFSSYEHARHSAPSVLSLLESRPGVVRVTGWRRTGEFQGGPNIRSRDRDGAAVFSPEVERRAESQRLQLQMTAQEWEDFRALLEDADLYGVEAELEVENYTGET